MVRYNILILLDFLYILWYYNTNKKGDYMSALNYIKRYAKKMLNEYKTKPYYQSLRDRVGIENLTLEYAKSALAKNLNFKSWGALSAAPDYQKRFIKALLSHPYFHPSGVYVKTNTPHCSDENWNYYKNWMANWYTNPEIYKLVFRLVIRIPDYFKPIKSINYKTPHDELYDVLESFVLKRLVPDGSLDYCMFMLGMLMSGFRVVKRGEKVYFNVSEKSVRDLKRILNFNKRLHNANADCVSYDCNHPNGVLCAWA